MNEKTIIDLPTFEALKEAMGSDFIGELVQTYFEETPQLLDKLWQALGKGDCDLFRQAAHSIKSTSNSFGALDFGSQAKELEMMGRAGNLEGVNTKVEALMNGYAAVRQALEELSRG
jgi:HPt (histidine-containing phosphotransfer) domain-containing protein